MNKQLNILTICFLTSFIIITDIYILISKYGKENNYTFKSFIVSIVMLTALFYLIAYFFGITKETFLATFNGPKFCRGGAYLYQGDSEKAKYCRSLYENPEGQEELCKFTCGKDQHNGYPNANFQYSPLSNSNWKNERCDDQLTGVGGAKGGVTTDDNLLGFVSNPTFQANLSPRFANVSYNTSIKYNMPDVKNLAVDPNTPMINMNTCNK